MNRHGPTRRPWVLQLARWYGRRRVARAFDGLFVEGLERAQAEAARGPVIFAMTHVSWWDPFVVVLLDEALGTESYCLMDAENLARLPFFGWIGAVPLRRAQPRQAIADLRRHAELLDRPARALWIFPQGTQRPSHLRPLGLHRGVGLLAEERATPVIPVALSYAFRERSEPTITVNIGEPCVARRVGAPAELERRLIAGLDRNDGFVVAGRGDYRPLVPARRPDPVPLFGRLLSRFAGGAHG